MTTGTIYTSGGTVQAGEGRLYIRRRADFELFELCKKGEFAYVLTARQMGKSSLMIATANQLRDNGVLALVVDLTSIGTESPESWYLGLVVEIGDRAHLKTDAYDWWQERPHLSAAQRMNQFFERVLLTEVDSPVVIFIDEIDATRSLSYTDDFFAAIRALYNARTESPILRRLVFVLIGAAAPTELIKDAQRTPFNIGQRVDLRDFQLDEIDELRHGLNLDDESARTALKRVYNWTNGHPFLTQLLCIAIAERQDNLVWDPSRVDDYVARLFLGDARFQDKNLQYVQNEFFNRLPEGVTHDEALQVYSNILRQERSVFDNEEKNPLHIHLKMCGIARVHDKRLVVRNRIYTTVFDQKWVRESHSPGWNDPNARKAQDPSQPPRERTSAAAAPQEVPRTFRFQFAEVLRSLFGSFRPTGRVVRDATTLDSPIPPFKIPGLIVEDNPFSVGGTAVIFSAKPESDDLGLPAKLVVKIAKYRRFSEVIRREARFLDELLPLALDQVPRLYLLPGQPYKVGQTADGLAYIVMDKVEGNSLDHRPSVSFDQTMDAIVAVAHLLDRLHEAGLAHYDIKPHNIVFDAQNKTWLLDFGTMERVGQPPELSSGTSFFVPPERNMNTPVEPDQDIYSLGVTALYLLFNLDGSPIDRLRRFASRVGSSTPQEASFAVIRDDVISALPRKIQPIATKMTAPNPLDRYTSIRELADAVTTHRALFQDAICEIDCNASRAHLYMRAVQVLRGTSIIAGVLGAIVVTVGLIWWLFNVVLRFIHESVMTVNTSDSALLVFGAATILSIIGLIAYSYNPLRRTGNVVKAMQTFIQVYRTEIGQEQTISDSFYTTVNRVKHVIKNDKENIILSEKIDRHTSRRKVNLALQIKNGGVLRPNRDAYLIVHGNPIVLELERDTFTIGRGDIEELDYVVESSNISELHCILSRVSDDSPELSSTWTLRDMRSINGTWVNGSRLEPDALHTLRHGDVFSLGSKTEGAEFQFALWRTFGHTEIFMPDDAAPTQPILWAIDDPAYNPSKEPFAWLDVITGLDGMQTIPVFRSHIVIGRHKKLSIDSAAVSKEHCTLEVSGKKLSIKAPYVDLTNGLWVNDLELKGFGDTQLHDGDRITIGRFIVLQVRFNGRYLD